LYADPEPELKLIALLTVLRSPMSAASGANTPISYKANVNRNKTRKWADAKPVDYGGDEWGDDDEYDPPPPRKPTGLRQQGQGLPSPSASTPIDKKNYGVLPPLPLLDLLLVDLA